jgi:hypothetical protein
MVVGGSRGADVTDNPYWTAVSPAVKPGEFPWEGPLVGRFNFKLLGNEDDGIPILDRNDYVHKYAWTITDPDSVAFIAEHAHGGLVDPMAGTGYWAFVLQQIGVDSDCYDLRPRENPYHDGEALWVDVHKLDAAEAVAQHPERTLLMAWPPYSEDVGERTLRAYAGERVIYIGEGNGGCTGDDAMHDILDDEWEEVAAHRPVQWWGLHDTITVYARRPSDVAARLVAQRQLRAEKERDAEMSRADEPAGDLVSALQEGDTE